MFALDLSWFANWSLPREPEYIYAYLDSQNPIILHFTCIMFENSLSLGLPPPEDMAGKTASS